MKKNICILTLSSFLFIGCSDNKETKEIKSEPKVLDAKVDQSKNVINPQTTSNEINLDNKNEFYNIKKAEFNDTNKKEAEIAPKKESEQKEDLRSPEEKSKVVGMLKGVNELYNKTKENLPGTAEESLKVIKEKSAAGAEIATQYAKDWLRESWEESKRNTQEAKLKKNMEQQEAKK